jgi:hypothetical protein
MLPLRYLLALGLTLAVEIPLYAVALSLGWRVPLPRALLLALGVNLCTHPLLWWTLAPMTGRTSYGLMLLAFELGVCVVGALLLAALLPKPRRPDPLLLALSVAVNGASVLVGLIVSPA